MRLLAFSPPERRRSLHAGCSGGPLSLAAGVVLAFAHRWLAQPVANCTVNPPELIVSSRHKSGGVQGPHSSDARPVTMMTGDEQRNAGLPCHRKVGLGNDRKSQPN